MNDFFLVAAFRDWWTTSNVTRRIAVTLACAAFTLPLPARGEDIGLDLVLLLDVSRSNHNTRGSYVEMETADGSDPQRIRWDAVKLLLDLMTVNDRIAILKFNQACPASYTGTDPGTGKESPLQIFSSGRQAAATNDPFDALNDDFPPGLRRFYDPLPRELDPRQRLQGERLREVADRHNTVDDFMLVGQARIPNGLDVGKTNIRAALEEAQKLFHAIGSRQSSARQPHVILLTDGLDDSLRDLDDSQIESWIEARAAPFRKDRGTPVKVHTLGLNLKALRDADQPRAKRFLEQLSLRTQGVNREVAAARDLIPFFRDLVRDVRGYWSRECVFPAGQMVNVKVPAGPRLKELTVMTYGEPLESSPKESLRGPTGNPPGWIGTLEGVSLPSPRTEHGKSAGGNRGLYRLDRFAPTASRPTESPFSDPLWPFATTVSYHVAFDSQDYPQSIVVFKSPLVEPFTLVKPDDPDRLWKRYDTDFEIAVRLANLPDLQPDDFRVTARYRRMGVDAPDVGLSGSLAHRDCETGNAPLELPPQTIELKSSATDPRLLVASLCLDSILPAKMMGTEHIEFTILLEGLTHRPHLLSGMRRTMLPVTIGVQHQPLELRSETAKILLTHAEPRRKVRIAPAGCLNHAASVRVQFEPPQPETGSPLRAEDFLLVNDGKPLMDRENTLTPDGLVLDIGLMNDAATYEHIPYRPGKLKVELLEDGKWTSRLTMPVELILEKIPLEFSNTPNTLVAANQPQRTTAIMVVPLNNADRDLKRTVDVVLEPAPAESENNADVDEKWFPAKFPAAQLWLQPAEDEKPALPESRRPRQTLALGKTFRVWFLPTDQPAEGQYRYEVRTVGTDIGTARAIGQLDVGKPQVDVVAQALFGEPGTSVNGQVVLKLKDLLGAKRLVALRSSFREADKIEFKSPDRPSVLVPFVGPTINNPVTLTTPKEINAPVVTTPADIQLVLPPDMEVGAYEGEIQVAGPGLSTTTVLLSLLVDRLVLELPSLDPQDSRWIPWQSVDRDDRSGDGLTGSSTAQFVQFEERPGLRRVRVRRESGRPLNKSHIHSEFKGELTSSGDVQPEPPTVRDELIQDENAVIMTLEFPAVKHFNAERRPYSIPLVVQPRLETVQKGECPAFRKVERVFEVQYVRLQDLFGSTTP